MDYKIVFVVTRFGCNSTPNHLWTPIVKVFDNYEQAYNYFKLIAPRLDDPYNIATQYINKKRDEYINNLNNDLFNLRDDLIGEYNIVLESIIQKSKYLDDTNDLGNYAKRPEGVSITINLILSNNS